MSYRHGESIHTGRSLWAGVQGEESRGRVGTLGEATRVVEGAQKRGVRRADDRYGWVREDDWGCLVWRGVACCEREGAKVGTLDRRRIQGPAFPSQAWEQLESGGMRRWTGVWEAATSNRRPIRRSPFSKAREQHQRDWQGMGRYSRRAVCQEDNPPWGNPQHPLTHCPHHSSKQAPPQCFLPPFFRRKEITTAVFELLWFYRDRVE